MLKHYYMIGLYNDPTHHTDHYGYVMDDFGNLVALDEVAFDQNVYHKTGVML